MSIRSFNLVKSKKYSDNDYLKIALESFSLDECINNETFNLRLLNLVKKQSQYILKSPQFEELIAIDDIDSLSHCLFKHVINKLEKCDINRGFSSWISIVAKYFFMDMSKKLCGKIITEDKYDINKYINKCIDNCYNDHEKIEALYCCIHSLKLNTKYDDELIYKLLLQVDTISSLAEEYNVSVSTLKKLKSKLKQDCIEWFRENGYDIKLEK